MSPWIDRSQQPAPGRPLAAVLRHRENVVFLGTLACSLLVFLIFLQAAFSTLWDEVTQSVQQEIEKEADTVARLLVFEFSHLSALETGSAEDAALDQLVQRLLWEKVTFNETIRGIELISRHLNADGQYLSYSFFPTGFAHTEAERAPQKIWRTYAGPEADLIRLLIREQRVDRTLLEAVNQGRKVESELLLRYFPLYIPLPERGAAFWGVVKVGISIDAMRRFLLLLDAERNTLRQTLLGAMAVVTCFALIVGLLGFRWQSRRTAGLLTGYTSLATALAEGASLDPVSLQIHLKQLDAKNITELQQLQRFCLHLGATLQTLADRLVAQEGQAARGRLLCAVLPRLTAAGQDQIDPAAWADLFAPRPESWQEVSLAQPLQQLAHLLRALLPHGVSFQISQQPVKALSGCEANLILALLLMVDFALTAMTPPGEVSWQVAPDPAGALLLSLTFPGQSVTQAEIDRLLRPFQIDQTSLPPLGPFVLAAIARQHGGTLTLTPQPTGGLAMTLRLPGQPHPAVQG